MKFTILVALMSTLSLFADVRSQNLCPTEPFVKECYIGYDKAFFEECVDKESICQVSDALNCGKKHCSQSEKCCRHKNQINNVRCERNCEGDYYEDTSLCGNTNCEVGKICCLKQNHYGNCVNIISECTGEFKYKKIITKDTSNPIPNKRKRKFKKF
jgi:hypothetical protein